LIIKTSERYRSIYGSSLSRRCRYTRDDAIDFIFTVALDGFVSGKHFPARSDNQREHCYNSLKSESFSCHHCGVMVTFLSGAGFEQFTYDRTVFDATGNKY
jgi:hypothetical protein